VGCGFFGGGCWLWVGFGNCRIKKIVSNGGGLTQNISFLKLQFTEKCLVGRTITDVELGKRRERTAQQQPYLRGHNSRICGIKRKERPETGPKFGFLVGREDSQSTQSSSSISLEKEVNL